jgi:hypothetical protein
MFIAGMHVGSPPSQRCCQGQGCAQLCACVTAQATSTASWWRVRHCASHQHRKLVAGGGPKPRLSHPHPPPPPLQIVLPTTSRLRTTPARRASTAPPPPVVPTLSARAAVPTPPTMTPAPPTTPPPAAVRCNLTSAVRRLARPCLEAQGRSWPPVADALPLTLRLRGTLATPAACTSAYTKDSGNGNTCSRECWPWAVCAARKAALASTPDETSPAKQQPTGTSGVTPSA